MLIIIGAIMLQYVTILQWGKCLGAQCPWGILSWGILSFGAKCLLASYSNLSNFDEVLGHVLLKWIVIPYEYV